MSNKVTNFVTFFSNVLVWFKLLLLKAGSKTTNWNWPINVGYFLPSMGTLLEKEFSREICVCLKVPWVWKLEFLLKQFINLLKTKLKNISSPPMHCKTIKAHFQICQKELKLIQVLSASLHVVLKFPSSWLGL